MKAQNTAKAHYKSKPDPIAKENCKKLNEKVDKSFINDDVKYLEELLTQIKEADKTNLKLTEKK